MRLIKASSIHPSSTGEFRLELEEFFDSQVPKYAILSHCWAKEGVLFKDIDHGGYEHKAGFRKIKFTCQQTLDDGLEYCWVDTCCIDKSSSAELSEAINSMCNYYSMSQKCYAFLEDVSGAIGPPSSSFWSMSTEQPGLMFNDPHASDQCLPQDEFVKFFLAADCLFGLHEFASSRWFERGWTLQELIAPARVDFYSWNWNLLGSRAEDLSLAISRITNIDMNVIRGPHQRMRSIMLYRRPVAQRLSWAAKRKTIRKEDEAYRLLGLPNVNMPLLYGEGPRAFRRLQEEFIKRSTDLSILAWEFASHFQGLPAFASRMKILAFSPAHFHGASSSFHFPDTTAGLELLQSGAKLTMRLVTTQESSGD